jgi:hypothetical protein
MDPVAYLKDVLIRVDIHPASRIDELLPQNWQLPLRWTGGVRELFRWVAQTAIAPSSTATPGTSSSIPHASTSQPPAATPD